MTSLMPETIEPATGTLPLPKAKKARTSWTQAEVALLVQDHVSGCGLGSSGNLGHTASECQAKLAALGLVEKPEPVTLDPLTATEIRLSLDDLIPPEDPQRTLAVRYLLQRVQSLLPKRAPK